QGAGRVLIERDRVDHRVVRGGRQGGLLLAGDRREYIGTQPFGQRAEQQRGRQRQPDRRDPRLLGLERDRQLERERDRGRALAIDPRLPLGAHVDQVL